MYAHLDMSVVHIIFASETMITSSQYKNRESTSAGSQYIHKIRFNEQPIHNTPILIIVGVRSTSFHFRDSGPTRFDCADGALHCI